MLLTILAAFLGCNTKEPFQASVQPFAEMDAAALSAASAKSGGVKEAVPSAFLSSINKKLKAQNKNFVVALAEYITADDGLHMGRTLYYKDIGNKQLAAHWVPGDPNRQGRTNMTWTMDQTANSSSHLCRL